MSKVSIRWAALQRNLKRYNGEWIKPTSESKEIGVPHQLSKNHMLLWLPLTAVLAALAFLAVGTEPEPMWECSPINPLAKALPANPCFRAIQSSENLVTLECAWSIQHLLFIYTMILALNTMTWVSKQPLVVPRSVTAALPRFELVRAETTAGN